MRLVGGFQLRNLGCPHEKGVLGHYGVEDSRSRLGSIDCARQEDLDAGGCKAGQVGGHSSLELQGGREVLGLPEDAMFPGRETCRNWLFFCSWTYGSHGHVPGLLLSQVPSHAPNQTLSLALLLAHEPATWVEWPPPEPCQPRGLKGKAGERAGFELQILGSN